MTLKLEGDLDILKMYHYNENEAASLRHSKLRAWIGKKYENMSQGQMSKAPNYFKRYCDRYSEQAQQFPASSF